MLKNIFNIKKDNINVNGTGNIVKVNNTSKTAITIGTVVVFLVVIAFIFTNSSSNSKIVGTWESEDGRIAIYDNNGYINNSFGVPGKYSLDGDTLTIIQGGSHEVYNVKFSGKLMKLSSPKSPGSGTIWTKQ